MPESTPDSSKGWAAHSRMFSACNAAGKGAYHPGTLKLYFAFAESEARAAGRFVPPVDHFGTYLGSRDKAVPFVPDHIDFVSERVLHDRACRNRLRSAFIAASSCPAVPARIRA